METLFVASDKQAAIAELHAQPAKYDDPLRERLHVIAIETATKLIGELPDLSGKPLIRVEVDAIGSSGTNAVPEKVLKLWVSVERVDHA